MTNVVQQIEITSVNLDGTDVLIVQFSAAINVADFVQENFHTLPLNQEGVAVTQDSSATLAVDFGLDVSAEFGLLYDGDAPGVISPQTVAIT